MGNSNCAANGGTPFEAEVVIENHTHFTLKEPELRKCGKCEQQHHRGLQMKQGKVYAESNKNPRMPANTIEPHGQHRFKISAREASSAGPEGFLEYAVFDGESEVGAVEFYFSRWANSKKRQHDASVSGEHCHPHLIVSGKFDNDDAVCKFVLHKPSCNITLRGEISGLLVGDGKIDMTIPIDNFLANQEVVKLLEAISGLQTDARKAADAAEKIAGIAAGPMPKELLEKLTELQSKGIDVNVGMQLPSMPSFTKLAGFGGKK